MKSKTMAWIILSLFMLISMGSISQLRPQQERRLKFPEWVSDKGYWVVESNQSNPLNHLVRFYDNENNLVYSEKLSGIKLNPEKKRVKMKLKKILETAVIAYRNKKDKTITTADMSLVSAVFR